MAERRFDVITLGDFRFPGGTSTAIAEELRAQAGAGYHTGLIQLKGPVLKYPHPFHPRIRACLDEGLAELLDPDQPARARLALAHHPALFTHRPRRSLRIEADRRLLVVHHPPVDGLGEPSYDWRAIHSHACEILGGEVVWAPIGPAVRAQLEAMEEPPPVLAHDWHNVIDAAPWHTPRVGLCGPRPVIGRHSRPDPLKWPDDRARTLEVYPDDPRLVVRVLGGAAFLRDLVGPYPRNWQVLPFNALPVERFLAELDVFVYFHHSRWVEAFGRTILEALASGAVAILPQTFEALFEGAALYAKPQEVRDLVLRLHADRKAFLAQSACGREAVQRRFGPEAHVRRLEAQIGAPERPVPAPAGRARPRRVLFMTSNGVGMGHLTRMLAIARRCPPPLEPVFLTLSQALRVVREQGFHAEYLPYHAYLGCDVALWNEHLRHELNEILAFYDPAVVVFDGNVPYHGLTGAIEDNADPWFVWCRRAMWQPERGADVIERERHFDAVIEPRELAGSYDQGLTTRSRERTRVVAPIRLLDEGDILSRAAGRRELGLEEERPAVLLQLGSGNNYDYANVQRAALARLRERHRAQLVALDWLIAARATPLPDDVRRISSYPFSRHLRAFDLVISAAGYNSFHELLYAGVPAILVPNEHPEQDDQLARARFAERHGLAACVRTRDVYRLSDAIDRLLDPAERERIAARCAALERSNGALEAARLVAEMALCRRLDRP